MRLAAVLSSRVPDYEAVAVALRSELGEIDVYDLSDTSRSPEQVFDSIREAEVDVVVAIGRPAAIQAAGAAELPVVYAQVFNGGPLDAQAADVRGVSALPPLDKQIAAWRRLNPSLSSVGAIVGPGHETLLEEAAAAASASGVRFRYRLAQSDRETLYQFTRLVPEIDGFWLFPDNRVLSAQVLREMLEYALRHRVQVAVFNDALLGLGATLSATAVDADIARTILAVARRLADGEREAIPPKSPLTEVAIRTGETAVLAGEPQRGAEGGP